jgi:glutathione S-transferase
MHLAGLLAATGRHQRIELGQQATRGVVDAGDGRRGRAQGDGQVVASSSSSIGSTGAPAPAGSRRHPGRGLDRIAQLAQALDVTADAAPVHAHALGQFGPGPLAAGLQQGDQAQQSMGGMAHEGSRTEVVAIVPQDGLQFTTHRKEQCHDLARQITLYHAARSRSSGAVALLEALGADYRMQVLDLKAGANLAPAYLAINPMGKVPAIVHNGALVTEQVAIYLYLADLYPRPAWHRRSAMPCAAYLRWMAFYGACFEPAMIDKAMHREPPPRLSPYNDAETVLQVIEAQLAQGPYLLGETMSAADVLWGNALAWTTAFGLVQPAPATADYIARMSAMTAFDRSRQIDAELAAASVAPRAARRGRPTTPGASGGRAGMRVELPAFRHPNGLSAMTGTPDVFPPATPGGTRSLPCPLVRASPTR